MFLNEWFDFDSDRRNLNGGQRARRKTPVNLRTDAWICAALWAAPVVAPAAADDAALLKDLTSVIALLGLPCGQVVSATRLNDDAHIATCQDGSRYRVFTGAEGRVVAERSKS